MKIGTKVKAEYVTPNGRPLIGTVVSLYDPRIWKDAFYFRFRKMTESAIREHADGIATTLGETTIPVVWEDHGFSAFYKAKDLRVVRWTALSL